MTAIGSLLAGEATAVGLPLAPSSTEEGTTGKTAGLQLHLTGNFFLEQRTKTPEPDFTDGYRGRGEAESEGKLSGGRLVWHPTKQHNSPRGGLFLGLHHYRRVQYQGEDHLETSNTVVSFPGATAEITNVFHIVGLPGDKFYLGFLSGQIFVAPATSFTRMTHYLGSEQEDPVSRISIGLAAALEVRLATIGVGPAQLHLGVDNMYIRELGAVSGGGQGKQDYLQLLAPTAVLEWRY